MSVWRRFEGHGYPVLVTTNIEGRRPIFSGPLVSELMEQVISEVHAEERFELLAFVIMPDHLHLVLAVPQSTTLGRVMQLIKGRFANRCHKSFGGSGPLWQSRYHDRALKGERELNAAIAYVEQNPVAAGLVAEAAEYRWSSARTTPLPVRLRA